MIKEINKKIEEELKRLLEKENLSSSEINSLLAIKNDLEYENKMRDLLKVAI